MKQEYKQFVQRIAEFVDRDRIYKQAKGDRFTVEAAMAKLTCSELAMKATTKCLQFFGGYGYTRDFPMERMMRDAKITEIYEGTSEIQRVVISSNVL